MTTISIQNLTKRFAGMPPTTVAAVAAVALIMTGVTIAVLVGGSKTLEAL